VEAVNDWNGNDAEPFPGTRSQVSQQGGAVDRKNIPRRLVFPYFSSIFPLNFPIEII